MAQSVSSILKDPQVEAARLPPQAIEAEQSVIGALLLDNTAWDRVADVVTGRDFYNSNHRLIFQHIGALVEAGKPADALTVAESLERSAKLVDVGGQAYLGSLAANTPSAANIRRYAEIVRDRSIMRSLAAVGTEIADIAYSPMGRTAAQMLDEAEGKVFEIAEEGARGKKGFVQMNPLMAQVVTKIDQLHSEGGANGITGLATGYTDLDDMTSGFQPGNLIVVAGRPGTGKTSICMNIAEHVALEVKMPVAIFSLEMSANELALRLLSSVSRINQLKLRTANNLSDEDFTKITKSMQRLQEAPIYIDETAAINPLELRSRARRLYRECGGPGLGLLIVDYLQLMSVADTRNQENRATQVAEISRSLKALAKELSIPIIALSQLNRSPEHRDNKKPQMSDLRESGAIEQDADMVLLISRTDPTSPDPAERRKVELIVAKNRNGPTGEIPMTFLNEITRFESRARDAYDGARGY